MSQEEKTLFKVSVKDDKGKAALKNIEADKIIILTKNGDSFTFYGVDSVTRDALNVKEMFEMWGAFSEMFLNSIPLQDEERDHLMKLLCTIVHCIQLAAKNKAQRDYRELH